MSNEENRPIHVMGEERRHPEIRKLARACIELARLRLSQQKEADSPANEPEPVRKPDADTGVSNG